MGSGLAPRPEASDVLAGNDAQRFGEGADVVERKHPARTRDGVDWFVSPAEVAERPCGVAACEAEIGPPVREVAVVSPKSSGEIENPVTHLQVVADEK